MNQNSKHHVRALNRLAALLLAAAFVWAAALPAFAEGEAAAQSDTIYINSTSDLIRFAQRCAVDSWSKGKTVILQEDLSLKDVDWEPIPSFSGTFRGNSHEIRDLELEGSYSPAGLFAVVEKGAVVESLSVQGWVAPGGEKGTVGGITGRNDDTGVLDRCTSRSIITGKSCTGGIAGQNSGSITSCTNVGAVNADYQDTTLNLDGLSADVLSYIEQKVDASAEPVASNAPPTPAASRAALRV